MSVVIWALVWGLWLVWLVVVEQGGNRVWPDLWHVLHGNCVLMVNLSPVAIWYQEEFTPGCTLDEAFILKGLQLEVKPEQSVSACCADW